jgi:hypothetical protein
MTYSGLAEQAVNGVPKPIGEIDDDDEAHMTAEEYEVSTLLSSTLRRLTRQAYADAMAAV